MTEHAPGDPPDRIAGDPDAPGAPSEATPPGDVGAAPATRAKAGAAPPTTKTGIAFSTLIAGAVVLILLLVFILENTESVNIAYFGVGFHLPLGVALLLAAIGGALLVGIVGAARIVQLRRHVRRRRRH
jgi:uncharacterized integral membrane protein